MIVLPNSLQALEDAHQLRKRTVVEGPESVRLPIDGKSVLSFCSNNYLGLANHPDIIAAAKRGLDEYGVGAGASHLISGHRAAHEELEHALASFMRMPRALYFPSGYMANLGVISALAGKSDAIFSDRLNHASLIDGARLSRANVEIYPHKNISALEKLLVSSKSKNKLVITDAVFSMDGDIAPVEELLALCERYDARLLLDDAHGFGVLGAYGRGVLEHFDLSSPRIIYMGTLGKAAGVSGAFVAGESDVIEWLIQKARTYIYTTASPPHLCLAILASLKIIGAECWRRERLQQHITQLQSELVDTGFALLPSATPVQALIVGPNEAALQLANQLRQHNIWVPAIRPPTVPANTARLRISLSADHTAEDISLLISALKQTRIA